MKQPEWQRGGICGALSSTSQPSEQRERDTYFYLSSLSIHEGFSLQLKLSSNCHFLLINLRSPRDYVGPPFFRSFALSPLDGASVREAHCEQASTAVREAHCAQATVAFSDI